MKKIKIPYVSNTTSFIESFYPGDAGTDLIANSVKYDFENDMLVYDIDLKIEIPEGFVGLIFPRSSIYKTDLALVNSVGVIDSGFRGKLSANFYIKPSYYLEVDGNHFQDLLNEGKFPIYPSKKDFKKKISVSCDIYKPGDKIAQIVFIPFVSPAFEKVTKLTESVRGEKGFGSSGN